MNKYTKPIALGGQTSHQFDNSLRIAVRGLLIAFCMALTISTVIPDVQADDALPPTSMRSMQKRGWFKRCFSKPTWEQAVAECKTPREACRMIQRHITFVDESDDQWSSSSQTWERGGGDCEDMAICIQTLCRELGFATTLDLYYSTKPVTAGHAVLVGKWNGKLWVSSNGSYEEVSSMDEVARLVSTILWCDKDAMWSVALDDAAVQRKIAGGPLPIQEKMASAVARK